jgi:hypothetical protein
MRLRRRGTPVLSSMLTHYEVKVNMDIGHAESDPDSVSRTTNDPDSFDKCSCETAAKVNCLWNDCSANKFSPE